MEFENYFDNIVGCIRYHGTNNLQYIGFLGSMVFFSPYLILKFKNTTEE